MSELLYRFPCGCSFVQQGSEIKSYDGLPKLEIDFYNLPDCKAAWDILSLGRTRGIFQLESNFGRSNTKNLEPSAHEHLAALIALLRPGVSMVILDGKNMVDHFMDRKKGLEPVTYIDDRLELYLGQTYGTLLYQEQLIKIAKGLAKFTSEQANALRKGVAKKLMDELFKLKDDFVNGCVNNEMTPEGANQLFEDIKKSGRYLFGGGHSYGYEKMTYMTAYIKAHFPIHFYCSYLKSVKNKDELKDLLSEMSLFNIQIKAPTASNLSSKFTIKDGYIQYGVGEVGGVGKISSEKLIEKVLEKEKELNKPIGDFTWWEFLILVSPLSDSGTISSLLSCGFMDHTNISRTRQLKEYQSVMKLTGIPEQKWLKENWKNYSNLVDMVTAMLAAETTKGTGKKIEICPLIKDGRRKVLQSILNSILNPANTMEDTVKSICDAETELLGISISRSKTIDKERLGNLKCLDFCLGRGYNNLRIVAEVVMVDERVIKTGKNANKKFANIKFRDTSGEIECTIFSKEWMELKSEVVLGNVVLINGKRNQDKSLRIESVKVL